MAGQYRRVLVINPNTSTAITETFKPIIAELDLPNTTITYWTSSSGPAMIKTKADLVESASLCLPSLVEVAHMFDGFLAACYADHPLVRMLRAAVQGKPVVSIFEASLLACVQLVDPQSTFGIVTTAKAYESMLDESVEEILGAKEYSSRFAGTCATGLGLRDLHPSKAILAGRKMMEATANLITLSNGTLKIISMGGVILAGKEHWVRKACQRELGHVAGDAVKIVDQLLAGMLVLDAQLRDMSSQDIDFNRALR